MKKNIAKPHLKEQELNVLSAQIKTIFRISIDEAKDMKRRHRKKLWEFIEVLGEMINEGAWEEALRIAFKNESFEQAFAGSFKIILNADRDDFTNHGAGNCYEDIHCSTMKLVAVYEYMTGKDYLTGEKLHKGVIDG